MSRERAQECWGQYTKDTEIVAIFLRDEGSKFGCPPTWLETPKPDGKHSYILHLYNFTRIADYLVKENAFSVPQHIMDAVDRVIKLRSECNHIYEELAPERAAANERHKHPIRIFKEIRETLLPKSSSGSACPSDELQRPPGKR